MMKVRDSVRAAVDEGVEQAVAQHDPDHLKGPATLGHGEQQDAADGHQRCAKQQPGPGF